MLIVSHLIFCVNIKIKVKTFLLFILTISKKYGIISWQLGCGVAAAHETLTLVVKVQLLSSQPKAPANAGAFHFSACIMYRHDAQFRGKIIHLRTARLWRFID